jgi:ABC-type uncharacterized transport system substrate-binding protein
MTSVIHRRNFLCGLILSALATPLAAQAQKAGKVYRVGLLDSSTPDQARLAWWEAFRQRMGQLGYVEGQTVTFERRWAHGNSERLPGLATELVGLNVDIIVTGGSPAALAAKTAKTTIPIVMATGADPVELGLVSSLARPGANLTGVTTLSADLTAKRLELLREIVPKESRVAVLWDGNSEGGRLSAGVTQAAGRQMGVEIHAYEVRKPAEFDPAFSAMTKDRAGGLDVAASPMFFTERRRIADLALKHRLPTMVGSREYAEAGALASYGTDYVDLFRRVPTYVDKFLRGAKPADLPIEQPTKFELLINLKTAKALGLTIPASLLARADQVIE